MVKLEFSNNTRKYYIDEEKLKVLVNKIARLSGVNKGTLSLSFVGEKKIRDINRKFRNIDKPTNVISFPFMEYAGGEFILGDIIICLSVAEKQAQKEGNDFYQYVAFLIIHGFLHLLGFDHIREEDRIVMEKKEEEIFRKINNFDFIREVDSYK